MVQQNQEFLLFVKKVYIMVDEYVEIVHVKILIDSIRKYGRSQELIAKRIEDLESTVGITHIDGLLNENIPDLPIDTPIRVGGAYLEVCVKTRAKILRQAGYTNVVADRSISFEVKDGRRYVSDSVNLMKLETVRDIFQIQ